MVKLKMGELIPLKPQKASWWTKAWEYRYHGEKVATIYKQLYPQQEPIWVYRFIMSYNIGIGFWKKVPKDKFGYTCDHYKTFPEARKAMKRALRTQIEFLQTILKP